MMRRFAIVFLVSICLFPHSIKEKIEERWSSLKTFQAVLVVKQAKTSKLTQLDPDYKYLFNARKTSIYYQAPHFLRLEGTPYGLMRVIYIINSNRFIVLVPGIGYKKEDKFRSIDRKTLSMDFGIIGPDFWNDYSLKVVEETKNSLKIEATPKDNGRKRIIWLNPDDLAIQRSWKLNSLGRLNVSYVFDDFYKDPSGLVIPRRIKMFSPDGELVAEGEFQSIKINSPLPPNFFSP